jgi:type II restriction enzyme
LDLFWLEPGLKRSIDKVYEIVVYSLFAALIECLEIKVEVSIDESKIDILEEFADFSEKVIKLSPEQTHFKLNARLNRVGVTNAADRGLDM